MPLYPYRCTQCGHKFEKIQSFKSEPEKVCPKCGGPLERPLTAPGLSFKGAGWYVNDYASKGSSSSSDSSSTSSAGDSKTGSSGAGDSAGKTAPAETKSPAKTESASASAATSSSSN